MKKNSRCYHLRSKSSPNQAKNILWTDHFSLLFLLVYYLLISQSSQFTEKDGGVDGPDLFEFVCGEALLMRKATEFLLDMKEVAYVVS